MNYVTYKRQFEDTVINRWKKFLVSQSIDNVLNFIQYWKRLEQTQNTEILIEFASALVHDLKYRIEGTRVPAEFDITCYNNVGI